MPGIFISYRREDASASAGRIYDHLVSRFGRDAVFMDVDGIEPGMDFHEVLNERVAECDVLLAVIGPDWLKADASGRRRIDSPNDFVQIEVSAGLERNIRVIPILVDGAAMPDAAELPERLAALARRNALEITHTRFAADIDLLCGALAKIVAPSQTQPSLSARVQAQAQPARTHAAGFIDAASMAEALAPYAMDQLYIAPNIPPERERNARAACAVEPDEAVIVLVDLTVMGNARDAFLITDRCLRLHHSNETPKLKQVPFAVLRDNEVEKRGWWSLGIGPHELTLAGGPNRDKVIHMLRAAREMLK